jgi:glyoxylase I family protein
MSTSQEVRWSHVGLNCKDQQETEEFYTRWFGFSRARVVEDGDVRVVFLRRGNVYLELFQVTAEPAYPVSNDGPQYNGTVRHIAFQVDDVDDFLSDAAGTLPISLGPLNFDKYIPGWKTVWITDPDGVVVEISQGYTDQPT